MAHSLKILIEVMPILVLPLKSGVNVVSLFPNIIYTHISIFPKGIDLRYANSVVNHSEKGFIKLALVVSVINLFPSQFTLLSANLKIAIKNMPIDA